ncbi:Epoxide hydrolase-like protein [Cordyceps fumosorosea ARSEF 2679]|uniref:Epoxide hydrolase-like protein n=1 Tax=Cordyceps fumosorosea (strain ARSEF 2679) TaxID=1081104 RepID=A0A167Q477_CORFA|nr:Epoxide hydrolase-like protein [Cordyceps fumosorosea ARSEF 2679]OAA57269.1 Epoxide hydrolase-like protein [Cordyceps fumosorosea ARSEF 2679]
MFPGLTPFTVQTETSPGVVSIYGLKTDPPIPSLPTLLLLHGFPQNHRIWSRVAGLLAGRYNLVIIDLRGYGASSKPSSLAAYAKSAMARDCIAVMDAVLGPDGDRRFSVCAHDRGARVAHKLCVDHPARVQRVMLLDICPTLAMYAQTGLAFATAYFHWFFLIQPAPLPETLVAAKPREFAQRFMGARQAQGAQVFDEAAFESYVGGLADEETLHAMCQDYRASATLDLEEARADIAEGRLIRCPLRVFWGKHGVIEECFDAIKEWRAVTEEGVVVDGHSVDSGHYIPEQIPDLLASKIIDFFVEE